MSYLSNYMSEYLFSKLIHEKVIEDEQISSKINNEKLQFRTSSNIEIQKNPCPCINNKIKETPSS